LFQAIDGGYKWKGLLYIGYAALAAFTDSNVTIVIDNTEMVSPDFNRIEIHNASTNIAWTNVSITALGTVSKGEFEMIDNATVVLTDCAFTDMSTFVFLSNGDAPGTTWRRCGSIITAGGDYTGAKVIEPSVSGTDVSGFIWDSATDPVGLMDNMVFTKGANVHHAIEFGTSCPATVTLAGIAFTGFHATDGQTTSTLYFTDTGADVDWTVNLSGCTGNISYKKARAGDTVTLVASVVITLTGMKDSTQVRVFEYGTTTPELAGIEDATAGTPDNRSFAFSLEAATVVDIRLHNVAYTSDDIEQYTIPALAASLPIVQKFDRNYENPV